MEDTTDAAALAAAQAGYDKQARAGQAPASVEAPAPTEQPLADATFAQAPAAPAPAADKADESTAQAEPAKPSAQDAVAKQLDDIKAQVKELRASGVDTQTVNRMFGEIGALTRMVKQLGTKAAPTAGELATAMKKAEETAAQYPEFMGFVEAMKAMQAQLPQQAPEREESAAAQAPAPQQPPANGGYSTEQLNAIKALDEAHPDRHEINQSADFQAWLTSKGPDFSRRFTTIWNPAVLAVWYAEFKADKASKAAATAAAEEAKRTRRETKQDRLVAAQTPSGVAQAQPNLITDEQAARIGYERGRKLRHF